MGMTWIDGPDGIGVDVPLGGRLVNSVERDEAGALGEFREDTP